MKLNEREVEERTKRLWLTLEEQKRSELFRIKKCGSILFDDFKEAFKINLKKREG